MTPFRTIAACSLAGLALTVGIGAAENRLSQPPHARRAPAKDGIREARRATLPTDRARRTTSTRLKTPRRALFDTDVLIRCFEDQESGGKLHVRGDQGRSYGLFQFQVARWLECGGRRIDWGRADRAEQTRIMRNAIRRYIASGSFGPTTEQAVLHVAAEHNGAGPKARAYAREVLLRYRRLVKQEAPARPAVSPRRESASTDSRTPGAHAKKVKGRGV